jgi:hypothetical protein
MKGGLDMDQPKSDKITVQGAPDVRRSLEQWAPDLHWQRQTAGDLCLAKRALRESLAAAEAAGRTARHPRHDEPWRQIFIP